MRVGGRFCKDHMVFRGRGRISRRQKSMGGGGQKIDCQLTDIVGAGDPKKILQSLKVD